MRTSIRVGGFRLYFLTTNNFISETFPSINGTFLSDVTSLYMFRKLRFYYRLPRLEFSKNGHTSVRRNTIGSHEAHKALKYKQTTSAKTTTTNKKAIKVLISRLLLVPLRLSF